MNIVIYSTNSNIYDGTKQKTQTLPYFSQGWQDLAQSDTENRYIIATQLPGMFLLDIQDDVITNKASNISYNLIPDGTVEQQAQFIASLNPNIAIAASFYVAPFDWLTIQDSLIAQELKKLNIKTICHSTQTALDCFDKYRTHQVLKNSGVNVAQCVYVHHDLFINAGNRREVKTNVYRESVFSQIKQLNYPVIIKDTVGLSSYGMQVVQTFDEAKAFLMSKKNSSDRIVEELIIGEQFGSEIYGTDGKYTVMPPLMFSVNKYGITSPKQSVKAGPVTNGYNIDDLNTMLTAIAKKLNFSGITQVDLVHKDGQWYVIEINPRLSGMTSSYAVMTDKSIPSIICSCADKKASYDIKNYVLNIKFPLLSQQDFEKIYSLPFVKYISQIQNFAALQLREMGYCEVIIGTPKSFSELAECLDKLNDAVPHLMEQSFYQKAKELISEIQTSS